MQMIVVPSDPNHCKLVCKHNHLSSSRLVWCLAGHCKINKDNVQVLAVNFSKSTWTNTAPKENHLDRYHQWWWGWSTKIQRASWWDCFRQHHHQLISSEDPSRNDDHFQFYIIYSVQVQTQPRPNTSSGPRPAHTQWFQVNWKDTSIKEQISRSLSMYFWLISSYLNQIITEGLIIKKTQVSLIEILLLELLVHCKLKSCIII